MTREEYGEKLKEMPVSDWHVIASFVRIVKNHRNMKRLSEEE